MPDWNALLVHGAGGGAWEWNLWRGVLQSHAIASHALTLQPARAGLPHTTYEDYRLQVSAALADLPRPRVLIGASLGGLLAMHCASQADALVLVNPLPPVPWHASLAQRVFADRIPWHINARLETTRASMPDADDASALFAFRRWRDESGVAMAQAWAGIAMDKPACPALFVLSRHEEDVPVEILLELADAWQATRLETVATSHVGPLLGREATAIATQTVAWLNQLG